jgi:hypothetical protein
VCYLGPAHVGRAGGRAWRGGSGWRPGERRGDPTRLAEGRQTCSKTFFRFPYLQKASEHGCAKVVPSNASVGCQASPPPVSAGGGPPRSAATMAPFQARKGPSQHDGALQAPRCYQLVCVCPSAGDSLSCSNHHQIHSCRSPPLTSAGTRAAVCFEHRKNVCERCIMEEHPRVRGPSLALGSLGSEADRPGPLARPDEENKPDTIQPHSAWSERTSAG